MPTPLPRRDRCRAPSCVPPSVRLAGAACVLLIVVALWAALTAS